MPNHATETCQTMKELANRSLGLYYADVVFFFFGDLKVHILIFTRGSFKFSTFFGMTHRDAVKTGTEIRTEPEKRT